MFFTFIFILSIIIYNFVDNTNLVCARLLERKHVCYYSQIVHKYTQLPMRRLYTWTAPQYTSNKPVSNPIDIIPSNRRFRNGVKSQKINQGSDVGCCHNPVVIKLNKKLLTNQKST